MPDKPTIAAQAELRVSPGAKRRRRRTPRMTDLLLDQLPAAIAVLNEALEVRYCNARAMNFFAVPSFALRDEPALPDLLRSCRRLPERCCNRLLAFCREQIPDGGDADAVLRLSLSRDARLTVCLRRIERRAWMLTIEDGAAVSAEAGATDAWLDPLTGVSNRRRFNQRLDEEIRNADAATRFSVLMIDLDRFKTVNDTLGHAAGDALLCLVAQRLRRQIRREPPEPGSPDGDLLARMGGDEFVLLAHGDNGAESLAARIVDVVSRPFLLEGSIVNIGASVGVAHFPAHGATADELMRHADLALYDAKSGGRGAFRVFAPEMASSARARRALETDLRKALALGEFSLVYQPQLNVRSGAVTGFEALVRWNHPARGEVPPSEFIPVAEEIGCIRPLGEWVLRKACAEAARWPSDLRIAVNVSPRQLEDPEAFLQAVHAALSLAGLAPQRLELEITESSLLDPKPQVRETLHRLRAEGIHIAMDDFGVGYSSLSQLRSFPFSRIKIDRSFVAGLGVNAEAAAVVRAIAALGSGLGMSTTAEGVETFAQAERAEADGCTDIQGYLVSRPVPASEISRVLEPSALPHRQAEARGPLPRAAGTDATQQAAGRDVQDARMAVVNPSTVVAET